MSRKVKGIDFDPTKFKKVKDESSDYLTQEEVHSLLRGVCEPEHDSVDDFLEHMEDLTEESIMEEVRLSDEAIYQQGYTAGLADAKAEFVEFLTSLKQTGRLK